MGHPIGRRRQRSRPGDTEGLHLRQRPQIHGRVLERRLSTHGYQHVERRRHTIPYGWAVREKKPDSRLTLTIGKAPQALGVVTACEGKVFIPKHVKLIVSEVMNIRLQSCLVSSTDAAAIVQRRQSI